MDGTSEEITTLIDREAYSNNSAFVGEVEDVRFDLDHETVIGLALTALDGRLFRNQVEPRKGILVPYRWIRAVGNAIPINDVIEHPKNPEEGGESLVT